MIKNILMMFGLLFAFSASAVEVNFGEPIEVELKISSVTMNDDGMLVTYEGEAGKYGMVFATHNYVPSNNEETQGNFTGNVQAIDDNGMIDRVFTAGLWRRDGVQLRVYGYDDDRAHRIMWIGDGNLKSKVFKVKVWELD
jgi:hypothetical protein